MRALAREHVAENAISGESSGESVAETFEEGGHARANVGGSAIVIPPGAKERQQKLRKRRGPQMLAAPKLLVACRSLSVAILPFVGTAAL